jgi:hypothetical protein
MEYTFLMNGPIHILYTDCTLLSGWAHSIIIYEICTCNAWAHKTVYTRMVFTLHGPIIKLYMMIHF